MGIYLDYSSFLYHKRFIYKARLKTNKQAFFLFLAHFARRLMLGYKTIDIIQQNPDDRRTKVDE